ncbi:aldo/keto reductase [Ornithinibacillus bavariensis]|uniref:Oxidoreductase n=1 Tax=Ornithinibacillus bavariensis TaxID=545502 RepID=A0A919XDI6_9BACI|nr:aldo/keto reductase [Ornithinibacillus bavariensis]GIO28518.1 oxidoreductase [Ornithinibacillus bavariensis]
MKKNKLGHSELEVSALTLGCMTIGTDIEKARLIIDYALDKGINHLDTADLYDFGMNEEIVGEIIKDKRNQIIITTKVGNHFNKEKKDWFWDPSKKYILEEVKESLRRLKTDYIDFYMLHGGTIEDPIEETIEAFEALKKEGIIRSYGISSIRPNVIREYVEKSSIDGVMMQYSLLDRRPEKEIFDLLHNHGISVLARGPLAKGILSNHGKHQMMKKAKEGFLDYTYEELVEVDTKLSAYLNRQALALQYVLKHPAVASAVFGASSLEQVKENLAFDTTYELKDSIYEELRLITKANEYKEHI